METKFDAELIIAGAGSVGLLLANLAGRLGIATIIIDQKPAVEDSAKAIGISPISLEIMAGLGLADLMIAAGCPVHQVEIHGDARASRSQCLGKLHFRSIGSHYPFILALPQGKTETILAANLVTFPQVTVLRQHEIVSYSEIDNGIALQGRNLASGEAFRLSGKYLVACDGGKSLLRELSGIPWLGHAYRDTFLMGDFVDHTGWENQAKLFFTQYGSVESFPLPGGLRRYVLSTPRFIPADQGEFLRDNVPLRTGGLDLRCQSKAWESAFGVQRFTAKHYWRGRLILCGDAAHLMSPIVGQNMNTGFADAEYLASVLPALLAGSSDTDSLLAGYQKTRQRAARIAGNRAWFMMRLGTSPGGWWSILRRWLVRAALAGPWRQSLSRFFSMVSIPGVNLQRVSARRSG